jgi:transcription antitermination factor NusA-like protein
MKKFIEMLIKELVDNPDKVVVEEIMKETNSIEYTVEVAADDIGKVIGKERQEYNGNKNAAYCSGCKRKSSHNTAGS